MVGYPFPSQVTTSADSPVALAPTRPRALLQAERDERYKAELIYSLDLFEKIQQTRMERVMTSGSETGRVLSGTNGRINRRSRTP